MKIKLNPDQEIVNTIKVSRGGGILVVPPGQRYNIDVM